LAGLALVENGWRVLFMRTSDLVQRLEIARRELALESAGSLLKEALSLRRYHQRHLNLDVLEPSDAFYLPAVNSSARIKWGRSFIREVFGFFAIPDDGIYPSEPVFLVTLSDKSLMTSAEPQHLNLQAIKRKLSGKLRGLNYIGVIEPGYYNSIYDDDGDSARAMVSWHGHFLVWGIEQEALAKHVKKLNRKFKAIYAQFRCCTSEANRIRSVRLQALVYTKIALQRIFRWEA
jgi:hypothetical protein